jgi:hypothetical protein
MRRLWRALMFSFKAFRHAWRHGEDAQLVTQPDPPAVLHVVREELYEVPLIPEPELPPPPPPVSADKMTVDTAPFCVMDEGGNVYIGGSGGDAKRAI